jgi:transcription initiation factor IIF auxiliary subunit
MNLSLKFIVLILLLVVQSNINSQTISADNTSVYTGNDRWQWTVFVVASKDILNTISSVQYKLHPTFSPQTREIKNLGDIKKAFALTLTGWGTFEIKITINFKNGQRSKTISHYLKFIEQKAVTSKNIKTGNTAVEVSHDWWEWTVFIKGSSTDLDLVKCVEYTLHESFSNPVKLVCTKGSNNNKAYPFTAKGWGTFTIKIKVIFKDGTTQNLKHELVF